MSTTFLATAHAPCRNPQTVALRSTGLPAPAIARVAAHGAPLRRHRP